MYYSQWLFETTCSVQSLILKGNGDNNATLSKQITTKRCAVYQLNALEYEWSVFYIQLDLSKQSYYTPVLVVYAIIHREPNMAALFSVGMSNQQTGATSLFCIIWEVKRESDRLKQI